MTKTVKELRRLLRSTGTAIGEVGVALMREAAEMTDTQAQKWIEEINEQEGAT